MWALNFLEGFTKFRLLDRLDHDCPLLLAA